MDSVSSNGTDRTASPADMSRLAISPRTPCALKLSCTEDSWAPADWGAGEDAGEESWALADGGAWLQV